MAMPYVPCSFYVLWKLSTVMITEFYSCNCYKSCWNCNDIQELFLLLKWRLHWGNLERSRIDLVRHLLSCVSKKLTIFQPPSLCKSFNIKLESPNYLKIDKMNVDWVVVHCQIDDVKVISLWLLESSACTTHFKTNIINLYCLWLSIFSLNLI